MATRNVNITGMPYFPGVAEGTLCLGKDCVNGHCIALITQEEVNRVSMVPAGIIVVEAAPLSHTMIRLLGLGIPTVLVSAQQAAMLEEGVLLVIDGSTGCISDQVESIYPEIQQEQQYPEDQPVVMVDGEPVNLCASVRHPSAARQAVQLGAKAIGLVRSEFMFPANDLLPDKTFYYTAFRELCEAASPLSITFRLLDVAADKTPGWLSHQADLGQALGVQGVRLYHINPVQEVIHAQLDALAGLSSDFNLRLLVPYVVRREEFEYWQLKIRQRLPAQVSIGAMAETPASVLDIGNLFECAEFVAIGCNDLMQSLFAADRDKPEMRYYLDPYAPVLFRLLHQIAQQSIYNLANIQLCGVLAQIQGLLPVLLGLGYRTFSVDPPFIPYLARAVANTTRDECEQLAVDVCTAGRTEEVLEILQLPTDRHPPFAL